MPGVGARTVCLVAQGAGILGGLEFSPSVVQKIL